MPDPSILKALLDLGSLPISVLAIAIVWIHNRDDKVIHERVFSLEARLDHLEETWGKQDTANQLSAVSDQTILREIAKLGESIHAVSSRVDSISNTVITLQSDFRHVTGRQSK